MNGIILIILGVIIILNRNALVDYYEKINVKFGKHVDREFMNVRLIVGAVALIIIGFSFVDYL